MSAKAGKASNDKTMHTGAFAAAGQRLADTDDSFSSAPRGILIGQIPQILRAKKFDGTRGGQRLDLVCQLRCFRHRDREVVVL